ncbi:hypothetical protein [Mumia flava]|uniref:hypothetical protein n=1 Tax=Mumia flava TaxID=1348852 RepID=UPI0012FD1498|nr:hypothetical protein [Mumia flava]
MGSAVAVAVVCVVVAAVAAGLSGALGALVGAGVVLVFFGVTATVLPPLTEQASGNALLVALLLYGTKILLLLLGAVVLARSGVLGDQIDAAALGLTVIACTLAVTVIEIVAATRSRTPLYDLGEER